MLRFLGILYYSFTFHIAYAFIYSFLSTSGQQLEKASLFLAVRLSPDKNQKTDKIP